MGFYVPERVCVRCKQDFNSRENIYCPKCRKIVKNMEDKWLRGF